MSFTMVSNNFLKTLKKKNLRNNRNPIKVFEKFISYITTFSLTWKRAITVKNVDPLKSMMEKTLDLECCVAPSKKLTHYYQPISRYDPWKVRRGMIWYSFSWVASKCKHRLWNQIEPEESERGRKIHRGGKNKKSLRDNKSLPQVSHYC